MDGLVDCCVSHAKRMKMKDEPTLCHGLSDEFRGIWNDMLPYVVLAFRSFLRTVTGLGKRAVCLSISAKPSVWKDDKDLDQRSWLLQSSFRTARKSSLGLEYLRIYRLILCNFYRSQLCKIVVCVQWHTNNIVYEIYIIYIHLYYMYLSYCNYTGALALCCYYSTCI